MTTVLITTRVENEERMMQDAVFSWTENVRDNAFTVCVEEMQKFSGVHRDVKVVRSYLMRRRTWLMMM